MSDTKKIIKSFFNINKTFFSIILFILGINLIIIPLTNTTLKNDTLLLTISFIMVGITLVQPLTNINVCIPKLISLSVPRTKIIKSYFIYTFILIFINTCITAVSSIIYQNSDIYTVKAVNLFLGIILIFLVLLFTSFLTAWIVTSFQTKGMWFGLSNLAVISTLLTVFFLKIIHMFNFSGDYPLIYIVLLAVDSLLLYLVAKYLRKIEVIY